MNTINLAVDCMGSETSLNEILEGINESALRNENLFFTLFGKSVDLNKIVKNITPLNTRSKIINCDEQVLMTDKPTDAIKLKKETGITSSTNPRVLGGISTTNGFGKNYSAHGCFRVSGDYAVASDYNNKSYAVWIFKKTGGEWSVDTVIQETSIDRFGCSVALYSNYVFKSVTIACALGAVGT